jgi:hypothetical protein
MNVSDFFTRAIHQFSEAEYGPFSIPVICRSKLPEGGGAGGKGKWKMKEFEKSREDWNLNSNFMA